MKSASATSPLASACAILQDALRRLAGRGFPDRGMVLRLSAPCMEIPPLTWLAARTDPVRLYFQARDGRQERAGCGTADEIVPLPGETQSQTLERLHDRLLTTDPRSRYYGGLAFTPRSLDPAWSSFGSLRLVLPRFELLRRGREYRLACHILPHRDDPTLIPHLIDRLREMAAAAAAPTPLTASVPHRCETPGFDLWQEQVQRVCRRIAAGEYTKVVLARRLELAFDRPPAPLPLAERLRALGGRRYHFLLQFAPEAAFIGSSPERLYLRRRRELTSEALAGTRPRDAQNACDRRLGVELRRSGKEQWEHRVVARSVMDALSPLCRALEAAPHNRVVKLREAQHLRTAIRGTLRDEVDDAALLQALHPTPAVGGEPREAALAEIAALEPFARGWYAAPVGVVGRDEVEFAVAIRSALVHGREMWLYTGVGLVAGSQAEAEWQELENKAAALLDTLRP